MKLSLFLFFILVLISVSHGQTIAIKTNALYWGTATPNFSIELGLGKQTSLNIDGGYNPFTFRHNEKWKHVLIRSEFRYWTCERFYGHFFGLHVGLVEFNISKKRIPFVNTLSYRRYGGRGFTVGLSYGYVWVIGNRWNIEATAGIGFLHTDYSLYKCNRCSQKQGDFSGNRIIPTKLGLSIVYMLK